MDTLRKDLKEPAEKLKRAVGERVRLARKRAGFSSAEAAAEAIGMSFTALYELERGKSWLSPEMAIALSSRLEVPVASFFPDYAEKITPTPEEALDVLRHALELRAGESRLRAVDRKILGILSPLNEAQASAVLGMLPHFVDGLTMTEDPNADSDSGSSEDSEESG